MELCGIFLHCKSESNYSSSQFLSFKQLFIQARIMASKFPLRHVWNKDFVEGFLEIQANYSNRVSFIHVMFLCFYLYICKFYFFFIMIVNNLARTDTRLTRLWFYRSSFASFTDMYLSSFNPWIPIYLRHSFNLTWYHLNKQNIITM